MGIELFSGCGGSSTGFLDAGINIVAGFDIDRRAIEAYEYNHAYRGSRGLVVDLSRASGKHLLELAGVERIDVLIGGPPCQPFSIVGKRRGRDDNRASLLFDFLRLAEELRPAALFFENVPNLAKIDQGKLLDALVSGFRKIGYGVDANVIAAAEFGVPQIRRRLLLVAAFDRTTVRLPEPTHGSGNLLSGALKPYVTTREALEDLPPAADFGACRVYNHEPTEHGTDMLARFATLAVGKRERGSFHDRLHPDKPSFTLRAGTGNFSPLRPIHYRYDRVVTVRESARLQGFSDHFIWPDWIPRLQQYRQVGNAVPPPVASAVAKSLAKQLGWDLMPEALHGDRRRRPTAITLSDDEKRRKRQTLVRGASRGRNARAAEERPEGTTQGSEIPHLALPDDEHAPA